MNIYDISNLLCAYPGSGAVLEVSKLTLPAGKTIFILGKSGYGKSTLLETLALMSNPIVRGSIRFSPPSGRSSVPYELASLWKEGNSRALANIRSRHFSFIFQQTNLMPNFSVLENVYISRMIQGVSREECIQEAYKILDRIGLERSKAQAKVAELSGGQRQRLAFARAVISDFDVLFGDEPTGNLDEGNALELMSIISDFIGTVAQEPAKSAIIVSHQIDLALQFADIIVLITKNDGLCRVSPEFTFIKQVDGGETSWQNGDESLAPQVLGKNLRSQFFNMHHA